MRRVIIAVVLVLGSLILGTNMVDASGAPQTKCPIMNLKVDKTVYADAEGKRVYFCCTSCLEKFKADPQKYIKQLEAEGVVLEER